MCSVNCIASLIALTIKLLTYQYIYLKLKLRLKKKKREVMFKYINN